MELATLEGQKLYGDDVVYAFFLLFLIFSILTRKDDIHKSLNEFEIQPDPTMC